jgi:hypothetical protein
MEQVDRLFHTPRAGEVAVEPIGIWVQSIDDRAFCKVEVLSKHLLGKGPAMDRPVHNLASERQHGSIRFETHSLR